MTSRLVGGPTGPNSWATDEWPALFDRVLDAHIRVLLYSVQHLGYTIPPQPDAGWIGEAVPGRHISTPAWADW